jgi:hypothetical protein
MASAAASIRDAVERPLRVPSKERPPNTDLQRRRCSRRRSRARSRPATSARPERLPTGWPASPHGSRAKRWSPARLSRAEECRSPTMTRRARNNPCPKRCDSGTKSVPHTRRRSHASASPKPTLPAAAKGGPTWSAKRFARSSTGLKQRPTVLPDADGARLDAHDEQPAGSVNDFRRGSDYWTVIFDGHTVRVRDLRGMRYLARRRDDHPLSPQVRRYRTSQAAVRSARSDA